jgi:hypothetical protein
VNIGNTQYPTHLHERVELDIIEEEIRMRKV